MNTNTITLTWSGAKPDDLPAMMVGEARRLRFACGPVAGANMLTGFGLESCPAGLALGAASIVGDEATLLVTAAEAGRFTLVAAATLSSGETFKGRVRLAVAACGDAAGDY